jgi:hypothetical protein
MFQKLTLLVGVLAFLSISSAQAAVFNVVGAGVYSMPAGGTAGPFGFPGGGLSADFRLGSKASLSLGAYYLTLTPGLGMVDGTLGFKFHFSRKFYLDLGGYYNYFPTSTATQDYGAYGGLGLRLPLSASTAFLISPLYHYSLKSTTMNEFVGLIGLSFGMK